MYIQQGKDTSCQLVALLNAFIYTFGASPIKYKSREYRMLVEIGRGVAGPIISMKEIFTLLGVYKLEPPPVCDLEGWVLSRLQASQPVVFPVISPHVNGHVLLVVGKASVGTQVVLNRRGHHATSVPHVNGYECANAQFQHKDGRPEYMLWRTLASNQMFSSSEGPYSIVWHHPEEMKKLVLKKPERIQQAVRDYYSALKATGFVLKPVKQEVKKKKRSKRRG